MDLFKGRPGSDNLILQSQIFHFVNQNFWRYSYSLQRIGWNKYRLNKIQRRRSAFRKNLSSFYSQKSKYFWRKYTNTIMFLKS